MDYKRKNLLSTIIAFALLAFLTVKCFDYYNTIVLANEDSNTQESYVTVEEEIHDFDVFITDGENIIEPIGVLLSTMIENSQGGGKLTTRSVIINYDNVKEENTILKENSIYLSVSSTTVVKDIFNVSDMNGDNIGSFDDWNDLNALPTGEYYIEFLVTNWVGNSYAKYVCIFKLIVE